MKPDRAISRASKLKIIIAMPEYQETIGSWLEEAKTATLHDLEEATGEPAIYRAQGAYHAIRTLTEQFAKTFAEEQAAIDKRDRRTLKGDR